MKKKYIQILKQIQSEVPQELKDHIMKNVKPYAFIKEVMELAITDPEFPEEKKEYYKNMIASGNMDFETEELDEEVIKQIDDFTNKRILEEIEKKNLPKYAFKHLFKKQKKITNKDIKK